MVSIPLGSIGPEHLRDGCVIASKLGPGLKVLPLLLEGSISTFHIASGAITSDKFGVPLSEVVSDGSITSAKIADLTITSDDIADGAIISTKIPDNTITAEKLASSSVTELKVADGAITSDKISNSAVTSAKILDANITTAKIADAAVTTAKIEDLAVTAAKIASLSITATQLSTNAITTTKITDGAVTNTKIAVGTIDADRLSFTIGSTASIDDLAVTTAKLADGAVTNIKIAAGTIDADRLSFSIDGGVADGAITTAKLADAAVTNVKIATGTITADRLAFSLDGGVADGAITTAKLADTAVTTVKLADTAVTTAKITDYAITTPKLSLASASFFVTSTSSTINLDMSTASYFHIMVTSSADTTLTINAQIPDGGYAGGYIIIESYIQRTTVTYQVNGDPFTPWAFDLSNNVNFRGISEYGYFTHDGTIRAIESLSRERYTQTDSLISNTPNGSSQTGVAKIYFVATETTAINFVNMNISITGTPTDTLIVCSVYRGTTLRARSYAHNLLEIPTTDTQISFKFRDYVDIASGDYIGVHVLENGSDLTSSVFNFGQVTAATGTFYYATELAGTVGSPLYYPDTDNDTSIIPPTGNGPVLSFGYVAPSDSKVNIYKLSDLPPPINNIITLNSNTAYKFHGTIDLGSNRLVTSGPTSISGDSSETTFLQATTLAISSPLIYSSYSLPVRNITISNTAWAVHIEKTNIADTIAIDWLAFNISSCTIGAVFESVNNIVISNCALVSFNSSSAPHLQFKSDLASGEIETIAFTDCILTAINTTQPIISLDPALTISRRCRLNTTAVVAIGTSYGLYADPTSITIASESIIFDTVNFTGNPLLTITESDDKLLVTNSKGITNTTMTLHVFRTPVSPPAVSIDTTYRPMKTPSADTTVNYETKWNVSDIATTDASGTAYTYKLYTAANGITRTITILMTISFIGVSNRTYSFSLIRTPSGGSAAVLPYAAVRQGGGSSPVTTSFLYVVEVAEGDTFYPAYKVDSGTRDITIAGFGMLLNEA